MEPVQTVRIKGNQNNVPSFFGYKSSVAKKKVHLSMLRSQVAIFIKREKLFFEIAPCDSELNGRLTTSFLNGVQKTCICGNKPNQTENTRSYFGLAVLIA
ncbi:hypothetical protein I8F73_04735 [Enterococcus faecalis]|nr:hypothetical protein [Enterococcus faecalis]